MEKRFPSDLSKSTAIKKTADGFHLPGSRAVFMSTSPPTCLRSRPLSWRDRRYSTKLTIFKAVLTTAAWRSKPSWMLVAGSDRTINPDLERWYAERAKSHKIEVSGASHSVYVSHSKEVADAIESAALAVSK